MLIGAAARKAGMTIKAVRYYERRGLIPGVERNPGNYRVFSAHLVERLVFIRSAQGLGFSLAEIQEILSVYDRGMHSCGQVGKSVAQKVAALDREISVLQARKQTLLAVQTRLPGGPGRKPAAICPVIQSLGASTWHREPPQAFLALPQEKA
jgi:DNA-binding transcriptional MerR regulator